MLGKSADILIFCGSGFFVCVASVSAFLRMLHDFRGLFVIFEGGMLEPSLGLGLWLT